MSSHVWVKEDKGITTKRMAFSKGSLVEFEDEREVGDMGLFGLIEGWSKWENSRVREFGAVEFYKYVEPLSKYFKDQHNPTHNEIQMFEMLFPHLTGIIKENNND